MLLALCETDASRLNQLLPLLWLAASLTIIGPQLLAANRIREIRPGDNFRLAAESLKPGETLIVHAGRYVLDRTVFFRAAASAEMPVVVSKAEREQAPLITCPGSQPCVPVHVEEASHLILRGLELASNGGDGIRLSGQASYITLEQLIVRDTDAGVTLRGDLRHVLIRRNHILRTGTLGTTGAGVSVGCDAAECVVQECLIEGNWIHDTVRASQGYGIEIKRGSHSVTVKDNVIHDTSFPCIFAVGADGKGRNLIEGNVVWSCGDSGIEATADAVVRNNIILEGLGAGFSSAEYDEVRPGNLEVIHNTLVGGDPCLRLDDWNYQVGLVFANNAVYCESGRFALSRLTGAVFRGNVFFPAPSQVPADGYQTGRSAGLDLGAVAERNVYPTSGSSLIAAGDPQFVVKRDFNGNPRRQIPDAGAYVWAGSRNPGWRIIPGFKNLTGSKSSD